MSMSNIILSNNTVTEASANGTVVGTITITDNNPISTHKVTLTDSADNRFQLVGNDIVIRDTTRIDYETNTSHQIVVRASDQTSSSIARTFIINIIDSSALQSIIYSISPVASKLHTKPEFIILGNNFTEGGTPIVRIDGNPVNLTSATNTQIKFTMLIDYSTGLHNLTVFNGNGL